MAKIIKKIPDFQIGNPGSIVAKTNSKALKRVLANKKNNVSTMEGVYLSNEQLIKLGELLAAQTNGPDGVCFMIGVEATTLQRSVEIIPYQDTENSRKIYRKNGMAGAINVEVGKPRADSVWGFTINNDGYFSTWLDKDTSPGGTGTSQKTPPPHPPE